MHNMFARSRLNHSSYIQKSTHGPKNYSNEKTIATTTLVLLIKISLPKSVYHMALICGSTFKTDFKQLKKLQKGYSKTVPANKCWKYAVLTIIKFIRLYISWVNIFATLSTRWAQHDIMCFLPFLIFLKIFVWRSS